MRILSLQSWVSFGHVGNTAALFALQRLGAEAHGIHTVSFSNHPGHGDWSGRFATGEEIAALVDGLARRGALATCDAVLSGYLGTEPVAGAVAATVARVREAHAGALYCCDPVIGDGGRVYVRTGLPERIRTELLPQADLLTPNQFELEHLTGQTCGSIEALRLALEALRGTMRPQGPRVVLLTSAALSGTPPGMLDAVAADDYGAHLLRLPLLDVAASGAGDLTAAMFLFHYLRTRSARPAAEAALAAVHGVLRRSAADAGAGLALIEAQDELVAPSQRWTAETL